MSDIREAHEDFVFPDDFDLYFPEEK